MTAPDSDEIARLRGIVACLTTAMQDLLGSIDPFVPLLEIWDEWVETPICGPCFKRLSTAAASQHQCSPRASSSPAGTALPSAGSTVVSAHVTGAGAGADTVAPPAATAGPAPVDTSNTPQTTTWDEFVTPTPGPPRRRPFDEVIVEYAARHSLPVWTVTPCTPSGVAPRRLEKEARS